MSDRTDPPAASSAASSAATPAVSFAPQDDPLVAYLSALGIAPPHAAQQLAHALRHRAGNDDVTTPDAIAALDSFLDDTAARVIANLTDDDASALADPHANTPRSSPAAVRFNLTRHIAALLSSHPRAPIDPDQAHALTHALRTHHTTHPGGVLPAHRQQEMPRQPLGALPAVLRSQFWSSAYRFGPFGNRRNSAAADESPRPNTQAPNLNPAPPDNKPESPA